MENKQQKAVAAPAKTKVPEHITNLLTEHKSLTYSADFKPSQIDWFKGLYRMFKRELVTRKEAVEYNAKLGSPNTCPNFFNKNRYCMFSDAQGQIITGLRGVYRVPIELIGEKSEFKNAKPEVVMAAWAKINPKAAEKAQKEAAKKETAAKSEKPAKVVTKAATKQIAAPAQ